MERSCLWVVAVVLILLGSAGLLALSWQPGWFSTAGTPPDSQYSSLGEQIFFTGIGSNGPIPFQGGPMWLASMGGGCASCHGPDGRGGVPVHMTGATAPDIRFSELAAEGFTEATVIRAIREGVDEKGGTLDWAMPRWQMTDAEARAVVDFLKSLGTNGGGTP